MSYEQKISNEDDACRDASQEHRYNTNLQVNDRYNAPQRFSSNDNYHRNYNSQYNRDANYHGRGGKRDWHHERGRGGRGRGSYVGHHNARHYDDDNDENDYNHRQEEAESHHSNNTQECFSNDKYDNKVSNFDVDDNNNDNRNDNDHLYSTNNESLPLDNRGFDNNARRDNRFDNAQERFGNSNRYEHSNYNRPRQSGENWNRDRERGRGRGRGRGRDFGGNRYNNNNSNNSTNMFDRNAHHRDKNLSDAREYRYSNEANDDNNFNNKERQEFSQRHMSERANYQYGITDTNRSTYAPRDNDNNYEENAGLEQKCEAQYTPEYAANRPTFMQTTAQTTTMTPITTEDENHNNTMLMSMPHQRTVRAPHLRQNCRNDEEILELFNVHHKQSGISLDIYANIPVEIVPRDVLPVENFSELKVEAALAANIERCGYKKPTPVQRYGIPVALSGNDLMACAQTGSGKTAAFLIPVIQHILVHGVSPAVNGVCQPIGLILAPTRELALQIYDEVRKLTFKTDIFYDVVYGGTPYPTRFENDILVACPGRLKDIFDRGSLSFKAVKFLILDEADRMLEMGFEEQIEYLVASRYSDMPLADARQTLMFSATFPQRILNLAKRYLRKEYYLLTVGRVGSTTKNITQVIEKVQEEQKVSRLMEIIFKHKQTDLILIFVETKRAADDLHWQLNKEHIPSSTIHGDRRQQDRERALAEFKSGETPILVATDVASRGLDIPDVSHVIQYDLPSEMDDYTHRIGRTGRAGNKGVATAFYTRDNRKLAVDLFRYLSEHEQNVPGWLRQEVEIIEGEAFLTRGQGYSKRSGGNNRFGGDSAKNSNNATNKNVTSVNKSNLTWGQTSTGESKPTAIKKTTNKTNMYDDGGF